MDNFFDRVEAFRASLLARSEESVLVVGHATFFRHFSGGRMFANCELAAVSEWGGSALLDILAAQMRTDST